MFREKETLSNIYVPLEKLTAFRISHFFFSKKKSLRIQSKEIRAQLQLHHLND